MSKEVKLESVTLSLETPVTHALASSLSHFAAWSKQIGDVRDHLFKGTALSAYRQWFGVKVPAPLVLEAEEARILRAILDLATEAGDLAQALLARLEEQRPLDRSLLPENPSDESRHSIELDGRGSNREELAGFKVDSPGHA